MIKKLFFYFISSLLSILCAQSSEEIEQATAFNIAFAAEIIPSGKLDVATYGFRRSAKFPQPEPPGRDDYILEYIPLRGEMIRCPMRNSTPPRGEFLPTTLDIEISNREKPKTITIIAPSGEVLYKEEVVPEFIPKPEIQFKGFQVIVPTEVDRLYIIYSNRVIEAFYRDRNFPLGILTLPDRALQAPEKACIVIDLWKNHWFEIFTYPLTVTPPQ